MIALSSSLVSEMPRKRQSQNGDRFFFWLTFLFASFVLLILGAIILVLLSGSLPALRHYGLSFFFTNNWNPSSNEYGGAAPIFGTLVTSMIAMLFGIPISFGIAVFITQLCPIWLKRPLGTAIELLAGIPSIIYGIWGFFVLAPYIQHYLEPGLHAVFGGLPFFGQLFSNDFYRVGILPAGLILAIMVLPFITSIMRDVFETVPAMLRESAYGLGCTTREVVWNVILPYTRIGVIGGVMLGLGRALGETMAVTFVIGNREDIARSLFEPGVTISSALADKFGEATTGNLKSTLLSLGLTLFIITFIVLAIAKIMLMRLEKRAAQ